MEFELPYPDIELPEGDEPLVLVAPSTAQDPELRLLRASLEALAEEPVRVVATTNRRRAGGSAAGGAGERGGGRLAVVLAGDAAGGAGDLPRGHGTVARALAAGAPVLCCPAVGDMAENAARVGLGGRRA